jgi:hypothetical protein
MDNRCDSVADKPVVFIEREWPDDLKGIYSGGIAGVGKARI